MMESLHSTPVLILRQNNKSFKTRQRQLDKRVRNKKLLREEIYSNHNIFQSSINLYRNKTAQNIIWDKNYNFKCLINEAKEENSSLKAHIWNMEKENRRMERQLQAWNLHQLPSHHRQPYIDTATVETVVQDQDYQIVSLKMTITDLEHTLRDHETHLNQLQQRNSDVNNITRLLNHEIAAKKVEIYECLPPKDKKVSQSMSMDHLAKQMMAQNNKLDLMLKNIELKKKTKINLENQIASIEAELELHKEVTEEKLDRIRNQTRKMRAEEDGGIGLAQQKLKMAKDSTLELECNMQQAMNRFIQEKIPIQLQIDELLVMLNNYENDPKSHSKKDKTHVSLKI